jgi:pyruvate dehydrogenase E2 component (dihydrolipoamide acetyltransferase)
VAIEIVMPRLGWDMKAGTVVEWLKHDGDPVHEGDFLFLVESDKSTTEVEALDSGTLHIPDQALHLGEELPVGTLLAYLLADGERLPSAESTVSTPSPTAAAPALAAPAEGAVADVPSGDADDSVVLDRARRRHMPVASPRAKRLAAELGVDWGTLTGSSRSGRIVARDVQEASARADAVASVSGGTTDSARDATGDAPAAPATPLTPVRRVIGERMAQSARTAAAVTLTTGADASALVRVRADLAEALEKQSAPAPSYNDFFIRLVAVALREFPDLNASLTDDGIVRHEAIHIGLAVDTERGLFVPVVRDAQARSVQAIAGELTRLIAAVRAGKASQADLQGGTFTITNLGMYEIDAFTPIVNPPQCAILGIGRIVARPVVVDEDAGTVGVRKMVALSLTFDHRLVDGGPAARFLQRIKHFVERPIVWLTY